MPVKILSKRKSLQKIFAEFPEAYIIDVTSKSSSEYIKFSPFYPHGNIPVPFSTEYYSQSVEGIWQGLKVFEKQDIDITKFDITNMKNIKRTIRANGSIKGHRKGVNGNELLTYIEARVHIYLPVYDWVLKFKLNNELNKIKNLSLKRTIILIDYETNSDIHNTNSPLSHASLIKNTIDHY